MKIPSLKKLLAKDEFPELKDEDAEKQISRLQLKLLRIQQGIFHHGQRAIILFEGFDAAGKGGAIRRLTETLDPRGVRAFPIGPPTAEEQGRHYLYRFWKALPRPGMISVFDRTWYGRVLVERVDKLIPEERWRDAYREINETEKMLQDDGVDIVKIFLGISPQEQLHRFEQRLEDPYKQWKLSEDDLHARKKWHEYVEATDDMFKHTHSKHSPWHLIAANNKNYARVEALTAVCEALEKHGKWMEKRAIEHSSKKLKKMLARAKI
jgi:polyphosphate kinase 2 (PPK2 family)